MKILFDHQIFARQKYGGVSRYFIYLIEALPKHKRVEVSLSAKVTTNSYVSKQTSTQNKHTIRSRIKKQLFAVLKNSETIKKTYNIVKGHINKVASIKKLKEGEFDIFHPTWVDPYFLEYLNGKPFVITIHDTMHKIYPEYFSNAQNTVHKMQVLLNQASGIIAISENTKKDLVQHFAINPDVIHVVHHGCQLDFSNEKKIEVPLPFILFVGGRSHYKNFAFFIDSVYQTLLEKNINVVCVGGGPFTNDEKELFVTRGVEKNVRHIDATDPELVYLYRKAEVFVYPSLYEGFGIPILEAFSAGCPVVLSKASCFPEIAGDAGLYFETGNTSSLKQSIEMVLEKKECREKLIRLGKERLTLFSKERCAEETLAVYKQVLAKQPH